MVFLPLGLRRMDLDACSSSLGSHARRVGRLSGSALYETFARAPLAFERGDGVWLVEDNGDRYLDLAGGIAVNSLGHAHPHLVAALTEQAGKLWHVSNCSRDPWPAPARRAARRTHVRRQGVLHQFRRRGARMRDQDRAPLPLRQRSVPSAIARSPSRAPSTAARWRRSLRGASRNTSKVSGPRSTASTRCPSTTSTQWRKAITPETAAILVEPVQGEGGIGRFAPRNR